MKKNMYSLMLSENVVAAVDALALRNGLSRSAMVNAILAEHVSYRTPEMRARELIERMEGLLSSELAVLPTRSATQLTLRSALEYKYSPAVNYSVRLYRSGDAIGEVRASLRTRNPALIAALERFFALWSALEGPSGGCSYGDGRFTKLLRPAAGYSDEDGISDAIAEYIRAFDRAMKAYFDGDAAGVKDAYAEYRRLAPTVI